MKRLAIFIVFIVCMSLFMGCEQSIESKEPKEPPEVSISIGDKKIQYIMGKNKWDGSIYDREDTFQTIIREKLEIPFVEIGEIVEIKFENNPPEQIKLYDILLNEDGHQIYDDKMIIDIPVELKNGKTSFEINNHIASSLSSYYDPNKVEFRGFRLIASWGDNECEYGFIIKTGEIKDSGNISEEEEKRIGLYLGVMKAAFFAENGGDSFIAIDLDTLEGLSDEAKGRILEYFTDLSPNVYDFKDVKDDGDKFKLDSEGRAMMTVDGTLLWIELEEYKDDEAIITGVSWFGNLGAVFPNYKAIYKNEKWELELISMAIS